MADTLIEALEAMRMGTNYSQVIKLRGFELIVRPLSMAEIIEVSRLVSQRMSLIKPDERNRLIENNFLAQETLILASKLQPDSQVEPHITHYILNKMTAEELAYLYKEYVRVLDSCDPALETLPKEVIDETVKELKKNPLMLTSLSSNVLQNLVTSFLTSEQSRMDNAPGL